MYSIDDLKTFVAIADRGGITSAAEAQGLSPATVSHRLSKIETYLGVTLFHRSSRVVTLSAEGAAFHERVVDILEALGDAEMDIGSHGGQLRGHLRVTMAPWILSRFILPKLGPFQERHDGLTLEFLAVDRYVNLVEERQDFAIRVGVLTDSSFLVRKVADNHRILCASPGYIERFGRPRTPADLVDHRGVCLPWQRDWGLQGHGIAHPIVVSNSDTLTDAAVNGLGIAMKSRLAVIRELEKGQLVEVLGGKIQRREAPISSLRPANLKDSRKVDAFAEFVSACFASVQ